LALVDPCVHPASAGTPRSPAPRLAAAPVRSPGHLGAPRLAAELARFRPALLALARRITRDEDAAADVVQRACLKAVLHVHQYEGRSALRSWVWRITANEALLFRRERSRRDRQRTALLACAPWREHAASPLEALDRKHTVERVRRALEGLAPADRELVEHTLAGDRAAIARLSGQTGVCARTLRTRLYRARQRLRRLLAEEC
jgi:RNA polymerase sigma-70 factor (ECF subfamily)